MNKQHILKDVVQQADAIYDALRTYALGCHLVEQDIEGYQMLASLRERLNQSLGVVNSFEHAILSRKKRTQHTRAQRNPMPGES